LSCSRRVCLKHFSRREDDEFEDNFLCNFCGKDHYLINEVDEDLQKLIDKRNEFVNRDLFAFGLNNKLAKDSFEILKSILDEAKLLSNDPANFIHEFFSDLKNEIDLKKEEYVAKIEEKYEKMINEVLEIEKECKIKAKNKAIDLEKMVQEIDYTHKKWNESVNQLDFDSKDDEWKSIIMIIIMMMIIIIISKIIMIIMMMMMIIIISVA
jgi:hypothetical protein